MFNVFTPRRLAAFALPVAFLVGGCSSGSQAPEATKAVESISTVGADMGKSQEVVDKVIVSIDQLQAGGDLKTAFANYTSAVADLESAGKRVAERREAMTANKEVYVEKWQKDLETIQDPDVRAALTERKKQVAAKFDTIRGSMETVRDEYKPCLKNLQEIQKALALDLNPAGVTAMKKPLDKAKADSLALKASIAKVQTELTAIAGSMSAKPAAAPK